MDPEMSAFVRGKPAAAIHARPSSLSSPKAYAIDPGIESTRQVIAKSNQANIASHDIPELDFPIVSFADEVAEGPVMIFYFWSQFDCEIMIAVCPRRAFCSAAEQPERRDGINACGPFCQQASYSVIDHAAVFNEDMMLPSQRAPWIASSSDCMRGSPSFSRASRAALNLGITSSDLLI
jgi:hypothetical protein